MIKRIFRGEPASVTDVMQLRATFFSPTTGIPIDLDVYPSVSITEPSGNTIMPWTSVGVYKVSTGTYGFDFSIPNNYALGVSVDNWKGLWGGNTPLLQFNFVVTNTQLPMVASDGYVQMGDPIPFQYSQHALKNINKLIAQLKSRLNSSGKAMIKDSYGNDTLIDCDIYTVDQLMHFLISSLSMFNMIPYFTEFEFEDDEFVKIFSEILVRGALISALASKALIEKGREFNVVDNGVNFSPAGVSEILSSQYASEYTHWETDIRMIKNSMRARPLGLGIGSITNQNPAFKRLRFLRARQLI